MVFSSTIFLFGFLPIALFLYYLSPRYIKNNTLLVMSLLFYAWGEVFYIGVMVASIISNYFCGVLIHSAQTKAYNQKKTFAYLSAGVIINLAILISFKYANFITDNFNILLSVFNIDSINLNPVHLPLGISFFTFQAISYLVDVYRKEVPAQKNVCNLALYLALFPQLIAGPIVRYHDIAQQITNRSHSLSLFASGVKRFIYGLAKKMLIANPLGEVADLIFSLPAQELTPALAWIGVLSYSLQLYFDFSGYSDMAIGLGRMFGFKFLENFNYPYISRSLREFWQRWHISLSSWFKDYVYIPLGGNRISNRRTYINLFSVFILTGVWHGASWNFIIWGLFHGIFLAIEHAGFSRFLNKISRPFQHIYLLSVVTISWVFFRSETIHSALHYLSTMFDFHHPNTSLYQYARVLNYEAFYAFIISIVLSTPAVPWIKKRLENTVNKNLITLSCLNNLPILILITSLLLLSIMKISASTYNPFIYFRF